MRVYACVWPVARRGPGADPASALVGHVASMNGMSAPTADTGAHRRGGTPTVPQVAKPWPGYAYTLFLLFCVVSPAWGFIGFLSRDNWTQWAFQLNQARVIVAAIAVLAFLPIVRAVLGRFLLDLVRRIKPMRSGKHAKEAHPGTVFLGVVALFVVLGLVGLFAWGMCGQAALDWRDGPVTREGVTCTAMNPEARDDGPFVHIELTEEGGGVRAYDLREYELARHAEKGTPLYATIVEACQAPGTQIGISVYDRTGIIVDAWKR